MLKLLAFGLLLALGFVGLAASLSSDARAQARVAPQAAAAETEPFRVICIPQLGGWVDYPAGHSISLSQTAPLVGYLTVSDGSGWVSLWAPGQWIRVEKVR